MGTPPERQLPNACVAVAVVPARGLRGDLLITFIVLGNWPADGRLLTRCVGDCSGSAAARLVDTFSISSQSTPASCARRAHDHIREGWSCSMEITVQLVSVWEWFFTSASICLVGADERSPGAVPRTATTAESRWPASPAMEGLDRRFSEQNCWSVGRCR